MRLISTNGKKMVDIGNSTIWSSVYSTIVVRTGNFKRKIPDAIEFLKSGRCSAEIALETARQFNLLRDELSKYPPSKAIYDMNDRGKKAPWEENISPVVTSCANLYTTADGKDLLFEIVYILTYGYYAKTDIIVE